MSVRPLSISKDCVRAHLEGPFGRKLFDKIHQYQPSPTTNFQDWLLRQAVQDRRFQAHLIAQMADQSWSSWAPSGLWAVGKQFQARFSGEEGHIPDWRLRFFFKAGTAFARFPILGPMAVGLGSRKMQEFMG